MKVYSGRVVNVRQERVTMPNGKEVVLDVMDHPGASAIVALDANDRVALIKQYRHVTGGMFWEIPAGKLDGKEDPAVCARRELLEEAGVTARELEALGYIYTVPGFCDERIHLFVARGLEKGDARPEDDEFIEELRWVPLDEALDWIERGELTDAKSVVGLLRAARAR